VNPDAETVEKELERAFFLSGAIQESNFGHLQKVQWTRAARTGCSSKRVNYSINSVFLKIVEYMQPLNAVQ